MTAIDQRRWGDLRGFLSSDFTCEYVHTGERFGPDEWVRLNAEYPGFDRLILQQITGGGSTAACRSHVTGQAKAGLMHFECATFVTVQDGLITHMTEVWADVDQAVPKEARPV
ncbi:MAG: nuclear transport factor 2 family protein [Actinobacteria bacterium]|nr:nuclear transport factor 2 family protein [Actinomycetota bacterium]